uniref:N-acetyltransferase domain-containing protein n=1 Tax=Panagrolaimus superbus TaxID=310955 RepID=A0A914YXP2_9BILA
MDDDENIVIIPYADFNRWKEIMKIIAEFGWFYAEEDYDRFLKGFGEKNFNGLIAVDKKSDKILGSVVIGFFESIENSPALVSLGLYIVLPELRGKGIGTKLFKEVINDPRFVNVNLGLNGASYMSKKYAKIFGYDKFPNWQVCKSKIKICDINLNALQNDSDIDIVNVNDVDYQKLIEYDTNIQGGIRRDKFLKAFLDTKTNFAKIAVNKNGEIVGFGNIRTGVNNQIGLGPLYSNSKSIAETLLKQILESIENLGSYDCFRIFPPNINKDADEIFSRLCNGKVDVSGGNSFPQFTKEIIQADTSKIFSITEYGLNAA